MLDRRDKIITFLRSEEWTKFIEPYLKELGATDRLLGCAPEDFAEIKAQVLTARTILNEIISWSQEV